MASESNNLFTLYTTNNIIDDEKYMFKKVKRKSQHQTDKQGTRFQEIKMQVLKGYSLPPN
jgi:plastocyanin domain-containing protein